MTIRDKVIGVLQGYGLDSRAEDAAESVLNTIIDALAEDA